jgi:hypothetical protein
MFLVPSAAWAADPADSRLTAAVAAWARQPLYVDPDYTSVVDASQLLGEIGSAPVPVYVAVVPTGDWFPEQGDTELLAGRLAAANGKPGLYVVMDGDATYGVEHEIAAWAPVSSWAEAKQSMSSQLAEYLDKVEPDDERYDPRPARTEPTPPRTETSSPEERFTVGMAIRNGLGGGVLGLVVGASLAALVLGVAALVARRRGGVR